MKSPLFIFSLPRSGSTLLQRVLMSHKDIASVAEPWLMLPLVYAYKKDGVLTEYGHHLSYMAFSDFVNNLPNKENDYYRAMHQLCTTLYEKQCKNNEIYFLDKSPRYYYIIPEIKKIFPNAKFIFLFRNPTHVYSSLLKTFGNNTFKSLYGNYDDLIEAPRLLSEGYELLKDRSYALKYEDFVVDPETYLKEIFDFLELPYDKIVLERFSNQNTRGRLGDPTGVKDYKMINPETLDKWKDTFGTPYRKKIVYEYIDNLDDDILKSIGYSKNSILEEIELLETKFDFGLKDRLDYFYATVIRVVKANIFFGPVTSKWARWKHVS